LFRKFPAFIVLHGLLLSR